jgi:FkbM family methyltransferase
MSLYHTLRYLLDHPVGRRHKLATLRRFFGWQISSRITPHPVLYPFVGNTKFLVSRGMTGATGNIYVGLHEFTDMGFLLHFLRPGDFFVDIGANVGSYTLLASGVVGANTMSFEPVPSTFRHLVDNVRANHLDALVTCQNLGLGDTNGEIRFTTDSDTINHVATAADTGQQAIVPIGRLDDVLQGQVPLLMKIDVEGYETNVLKGAGQTLESPGLQGIIIELNGSGARYGHDERQIHQQLLDLGFGPFVYEPFTRRLQQVDHFGSHNTIYLRDQALAAARLASAPAFRLFSSNI